MSNGAGGNSEKLCCYYLTKAIWCTLKGRLGPPPRVPRVWNQSPISKMQPLWPLYSNRRQKIRFYTSSGVVSITADIIGIILFFSSLYMGFCATVRSDEINICPFTGIKNQAGGDCWYDSVLSKPKKAPCEEKSEKRYSPHHHLPTPSSLWCQHLTPVFSF